MNNKWVSFSPHILSRSSTTKIYITMLVLLCPVVASALITLSYNPLLLILSSMLACYLTDIAFKFIVNKSYDFSDVSALFIGFIIGIAMPSGASWYVPIFGSCFSIIFIRNIAGGIGKNFVSEIAVAILISYLIFGPEFSKFVVRGGEVVTQSGLDAVINGEINKIDIENLLFGGFAGSIAGSSIFWLVVACVILAVLKIIDIRIPLVTLVSVFAFAVLFFDLTTAVNLVFTGGVVLASFFVATDYAVVPRNKIAKYIYAVLIGFFTALIWKCGTYQMAIYYAIIIMGLVSSVFNGIDRTFRVSVVR